MGGMTARPVYFGVIGAGTCSSELEDLAHALGAEIARSGGILVCGGLGGVMKAAAQGAKAAGGITIGILPGATIHDANEHIDFPIASNMGQARNAIIVHTATVLISVGGGYGTLSEMAMALKIGKSVVCLAPSFDIPGVRIARTPREAIALALQVIS